MRNKIGIRRESVDATERRTPLTPAQVELIVREYRIQVVVERSERRVFPDDEYAAAGATLSDDLSDCNVVFGVKEIPIDSIQPGRVYCFFSHTVKAQRHNMPLLRSMVDARCTLLDYELVTNDIGKRLILFGDFAGYAGMIDTLWALGKRLDWEGVANPFGIVKPAHRYENLEAAGVAVETLARQIRAEGLPEGLTPFVCAFMGHGNVSRGAQKIFGLLPVVEIEPDDVPGLASSGSFSRNAVYKVEFRKADLYEPFEPSARFDAEEFEANPERYRGCFHRYLDHLILVVNGIYWTPRFPRLITKDHARKMYAGDAQPRLRVIADLACDIEGSIELTVRPTTSENPVYVYEPETDRIVSGYSGRGPVVLAVDKLATELPREASQSFGKALVPFIRQLAAADFTLPFDQLEVPAPFKRAVIAHDGALTENFHYLNEYLI